MDDYLVEFATLFKEGNSYRFQLDNGQTLVPAPESIEKINGNSGQRVLLNYTPLNGDSIKINFIKHIFTATIEHDDNPEKLLSDPVKIESVWVGGDYLNLIMEIEHHNKPHSLKLIHNRVASSTNLYLIHSRNNDPPGSPQITHASFLIGSLRSGHDNPTIPFRLFINTYSGQRVFELELK